MHCEINAIRGYYRDGLVQEPKSHWTGQKEIWKPFKLSFGEGGRHVTFKSLASCRIRHFRTYARENQRRKLSGYENCLTRRVYCPGVSDVEPEQRTRLLRSATPFVAEHCWPSPRSMPLFDTTVMASRQEGIHSVKGPPAFSYLLQSCQASISGSRRSTTSWPSFARLSVIDCTLTWMDYAHTIGLERIRSILRMQIIHVLERVARFGSTENVADGSERRFAINSSVARQQYKSDCVLSSSKN